MANKTATARNVTGRWECAAHGGNLGVNRDAGPLAWCAHHHDWIDAVWVEYVCVERLTAAVKERDVYALALELACPAIDTRNEYLRRARFGFNAGRRARVG